MIGKTLMPTGKQEGYCKTRTVFTNLSCTILTGLFKTQTDRTKRCSQMIIAALFIVVKNWEQLKCPLHISTPWTTQQ